MVSSVSTTLTNCPGHRTPSRFSKRGLQPDGAGGRIHRVVDHAESARACPRPGSSWGKARARRACAGRFSRRMAARCCSGTLKFTNIGRDLVDHHQRHVVRLHQVAGVHQQVAGAPGDRGADGRVAEVEFGALDGRRVAFQGGAGAFDGRLGGARGLAGHVGAGLRLVVLRLRDNAGRSSSA